LEASQQFFYSVGLLAPRQTPTLEDQASVFISPRSRVVQLYPQAPGTHFSRLLRHAWVTVGLFLFPGHHTGILFGAPAKIPYVFLASPIRPTFSTSPNLPDLTTLTASRE
jgi:hypothetical protein